MKESIMTTQPALHDPEIYEVAYERFLDEHPSNSVKCLFELLDEFTPQIKKQLMRVIARSARQSPEVLSGDSRLIESLFGQATRYSMFKDMVWQLAETIPEGTLVKAIVDRIFITAKDLGEELDENQADLVHETTRLSKIINATKLSASQRGRLWKLLQTFLDENDSRAISNVCLTATFYTNVFPGLLAEIWGERSVDSRLL